MAPDGLARFMVSTPVRILFALLSIAASIAVGSFAIFLIIRLKFSGLSSVRTYIICVYLVFFSMVIPSAETGIMSRSRHLAKLAPFVTSYFGRAFVFVFMGGLLLGNTYIGWIVGGGLLGIAALNILGFLIVPSSMQRSMRYNHHASESGGNNNNNNNNTGGGGGGFYGNAWDGGKNTGGGGGGESMKI